jgi:RNA polymerase sigma-70 factor (ECF subfamily)
MLLNRRTLIQRKPRWFAQFDDNHSKHARAPLAQPVVSERLRRLASIFRRRLKIMMAEAASQDAMVAAMPSLRAFAISLCRNGEQAEDLVQETLLRGCANITSFTPGTNMLAWLFTILRNEFYSECRRRRRLFESIDECADSLAAKPTQVAQAAHRQLCAALAKLPPEQRAALVLIAASGLSYEEAAKMCGCPTGTVKSRVFRAREELARMLSIEGPEDFEEDPIISAAVMSGDRLAMGA